MGEKGKKSLLDSLTYCNMSYQTQSCADFIKHKLTGPVKGRHESWNKCLNSQRKRRGGVDGIYLQQKIGHFVDRSSALPLFLTYLINCNIILVEALYYQPGFGTVAGLGGKCFNHYGTER